MRITAALSPADLAAIGTQIPGILGDLRSDHAGETGAIMIYQGIIAGTKDAEVKLFAAAHMETERDHLAFFETLLKGRQRSLLAPLWRLMGFLTGYLPAKFGPEAVYATIDAVETFVDHHYAAQIRKLPARGTTLTLRAALIRCQADEVHHRDEARGAQTEEPSAPLRAWTWLVGFGSRSAVHLARLI